MSTPAERMAMEDEEVEANPDDERGPSCVISGFASSGRMAHVVLADPPREKVITTYWPDTQPWKWAEDFRRRK